MACGSIPGRTTRTPRGEKITGKKGDDTPWETKAARRIRTRLRSK
jgi:hypothetical protein